MSTEAKASLENARRDALNEKVQKMLRHVIGRVCGELAEFTAGPDPVQFTEVNGFTRAQLKLEIDGYPLTLELKEDLDEMVRRHVQHNQSGSQAR